MRHLFFFLFLFPSSHIFSQDHLVLRKTAENYFDNDDFQNALIAGRSALAIAEIAVGKSHIEYAQILAETGVYYAYTGNFNDGIAQLEEALEIIKKLTGEKSIEHNEALEQLAIVFFMGGEYSPAEMLMFKAAEINKILYGEESKQYALTLGNLGLIQQSLNRIGESKMNLFLSKTIYEKNTLNDTHDYAALLGNIASVYHDEGAYFRAEEFYNASAVIYKKNNLENSIDYINCFQNLALLYTDMGRYDEAKPMLIQALALKKSLIGDNSHEYAITLNNLADLYSKTGNYSEAENLLLQSVRIKESMLGKEHPSCLTGWNNLALLYADLGRTDEAIVLLEKVTAVSRKTKISNPLDYAFHATNLATVYSAAGKYDEAEVLYRETLQIYQEQYGETFGDYTAALSNLAVVYLNRDERKPAGDLLIKAAGIAKKEGKYDSKENIEMLNNLACVYQAERNLGKAADLMREVVKIAKDYYGEKHPRYLFFLFNLAVFLDEQRQWDEAVEIYSQVIEMDFLNLDRGFEFMSESEKGIFYSTVATHFDVFYRLAILRAKENPYILSKVMDYRLATKAMLLNNSGKIRNAIITGRDSSLVDVYLKWKSQKDFLIKLYSLPVRELALSKVKPDSIEKSVIMLEKQLSQKTAYAAGSFNRNISWKQVQNYLKSDEAAVEIIRTYSPFADEKNKVFYMALIVSKTDRDYPRMVVMEDGYEMETQYCRQYRDAIFDSTKKEDTYRHFWERIEKELNGITKIYISIDGIYAKVNLNSVFNPVRNSYLLDIFDFHYVSSLRDLVEKKPQFIKSNTVALFGYPEYTYCLTAKDPATNPIETGYNAERNKTGDRFFYLDPLPGTKKEVEEIGKLMKEKQWKVNAFLGETAKEEKLKSLSSPSVLHIATHGYFQKDAVETFSPATSLLADKMSENPLLRSGLMMAGASHAFNANYAIISNWTEREDGILTAYEAMNLNLDNTELVVLSACETGLGEIRNGEGVYGLQRAFMTAGAKTVIMSLWSVSDEATQKLMTLFYSRWVETNDKHGAFQYAQLELKKIFPEPYFWSAFVMIEK
ncbi:MAG: CHAT domain-containing protein [Bacteroidetes bacterium]|nr:CHAT domain-containing protein [Bacteroidota bacterium]